MSDPLVGVRVLNGHRYHEGTNRIAHHQILLVLTIIVTGHQQELPWSWRNSNLPGGCLCICWLHLCCYPGLFRHRSGLFSVLAPSWRWF